MEMKYFDLIKPGTTHDFVKYRRLAVTFSLIVNALVLIGVVVWPGLNYGVDFAGGTEMQVHFKKPVEPGEIRDLISHLGFGEPTVQRYGAESENQFLIRVERIALLTPEKAKQIEESVKQTLPGLQSFRFDPEVGDKLVNAGLIIVGESPEYFGELLRSDYAKYGKLVKDIGFVPQ